MEAIRAYLRTHADIVAGFVVPHNDAHFNEYISLRDEKLAYVSNFTGSSGTALITLDRAYLWTDGRYFLQAADQLPPEWELMRIGECKPLRQFLIDLCNSGTEQGEAKRSKVEMKSIAMDATTTSRAFYRQLTEVDKIKVELINPSLLDEAWVDGTRPESRRGSVELVEMTTLGRTIESKLAFVRQRLETVQCDAICVSGLDEICWLLNLRSLQGEIPYNAVFYAYLVVFKDSTAKLFMDSRLPETFPQGLVEVFAYEYFLHYEFPPASRVLLDPASTNCAIVFDNVQIKEEKSCVQLEKAKKTVEEVDAMRLAQEIDAVALARFLCSMDTIEFEGETELSLAARLLQMREMDSTFVGNSFETISSLGPHSAVIHYAPNKQTDAEAKANTVYLLDSGGHYSFGGTTDTTRTIWLGGGGEDVDVEAKRCYTAVLKANIGLAMARFPKSTMPSKLDVLARGEMWQLGLDYGHGTGHGVGNFLCVHEYPPLISSREDASMGGLEPNMCVTNEPGYYRAGVFGFRIENLMLVVESKEHEGFLEFETITHVPMCRALICKDMLTARELEWLNTYHIKCRELLLHKLHPGEDLKVREWVMEETQHI